MNGTTIVLTLGLHLRSGAVVDARDLEIIESRVLRLNLRRNGRPQIGDYVLVDGNLRRLGISYESGQCQTTPGASFFLSDDAVILTCGGFDYPLIRLDKWVLTDREEMGEYWIFHHNDVGPGNGVYFNVNVPVFEYKP
jgi:hypothetical protein